MRTMQTEVASMLIHIAENFDGTNIPWDQLKECHVHNRLPRFSSPSPTCGKILLHSKQQVNAFREMMGISICVFKIGISVNPAQRFISYLDVNFQVMWVIYQGPDIGLVHMLEAALIDEFHPVSGCRNAAHSGGEGGLNERCHLGPPYFVYITGGKADQLKRVG